MRVAGIGEHIRYEPDEWCPTLLSIGVAFQGVIIALANTVLFVTIAFRAANLGDDYISWGITCSLIIGGAITVLQAGRLGRLGAAHILMTGLERPSRRTEADIWCAAALPRWLTATGRLTV